MDQTPAGGTSPRRGRALKRLRDASEILALTVVLALAVKTLVVDAVHVPSASMENTVLAGDFVLVNKFVYGPCTPRFLPVVGSRIPLVRLPGPARPARGDVIVFYAPEDGSPRRLYLKRIAGIPGDTVMIRRGALIVNGSVVPPPASAKPSRNIAPDFGPVVVPKAGETFILREADAPLWEPLLRLEGRSVARTPSGEILVDGVPSRAYRLAEDHFFVLGDNRDDSLDSRAWGFVPFDRIVGRAMLVYWSVDAGTGIRWTRAGTVVR